MPELQFLFAERQEPARVVAHQLDVGVERLAELRLFCEWMNAVQSRFDRLTWFELSVEKRRHEPSPHLVTSFDRCLA